jgi:hypothetical protein
MANTPPWYTRRTYLHFDPNIFYPLIERIVLNPSEVARHSFYPFISFNVVSKKIKYDQISDALTEKLKVRPIAYAAHLDSHIYSYYCQQLSDLYEKALVESGVDKNVLAFRKLSKGNIDFAKDVFCEIKKFGGCCVIASDIEKFFDKINHSVLKQQWCRLLGQERLPADHFAIFKSLTKYAKVDKRALYKVLGLSYRNPHGKGRRLRLCEPNDFRTKVRGGKLIITNGFDYGIPQGSPISALLSNLYLLEFDKIMADAVNKVNGKYFRYCDDIFIIIPGDPDYFLNLASHVLKEDFKLEIHPTKTEKSRFYLNRGKLTCEKPIQYLGFIFDGERILIRSAALARFSEKMKKSVRVAKASMKKVNLVRGSKGLSPRSIFKKKLYQKFSYLGGKNFVSYGFKAADIMGSSAIRKQLKPLWTRLQEEIAK